MDDLSNSRKSLERREEIHQGQRCPIIGGMGIDRNDERSIGEKRAKTEYRSF
jgi:hypothetical protein